MLNKSEWTLFAAQLRMHPWRVPAYGLALFALGCRRTMQRIRLRLQRDLHRGLKQRPVWLPKMANPDMLGLGLRLPRLKLNGGIPAISTAKFRADDPEAIFVSHRWAQCAAAIGDDQRAHAAFVEVENWLSMPPGHSSVAWESYSCCERVVNLAILLAAHRGLISDKNQSLLIKFFKESASWIDAHLEYYGEKRTNNHFLNNGRALIVAGCVLQNDEWLSIGLKIFERFAPQIFSKDGSLREGSSHYQLIVSGWVFDALTFASVAIPSAKLDQLEALAHEAGQVCGRIASLIPHMDQHIGDISPDLHPRLTLDRLRLLYGDRIAQSNARATLGDWVFAEKNDSALVAHAVREWPLRYTTHAHDDFGSFIWLHAGRAILADAGRMDYLKRPEIEDQVGPTAHNTLMVNGVGGLAASVLRSGNWRPQPYADTYIEVNTFDDGFMIRHNGFKRIHGVSWHAREVRLTDQGLKVIDRIEGQGNVELMLHWHFAPGWVDEGKEYLNSPLGFIQVNVDGAHDARHIWSDYSCSRAYGESTLARRLKVVWRAKLPCQIQTQMKFQPCVE